MINEQINKFKKQHPNILGFNAIMSSKELSPFQSNLSFQYTNIKLMVEN